MGVDPEKALWMTPREMNAAGRGWARAERTRLVTTAQAFGADLSEREARRIIEGGTRSAPSQSEQEKKLQQMAEKHGWDL